MLCGHEAGASLRAVVVTEGIIGVTSEVWAARRGRLTLDCRVCIKLGWSLSVKGHSLVSSLPPWQGRLRLTLKDSKGALISDIERLSPVPSAQIRCEGCPPAVALKLGQFLHLLTADRAKKGPFRSRSAQSAALSYDNFGKMPMGWSLAFCEP